MDLLGKISARMEYLAGRKLSRYFPSRADNTSLVLFSFNVTHIDSKEFEKILNDQTVNAFQIYGP